MKMGAKAATREGVAARCTSFSKRLHVIIFYHFSTFERFFSMFYPYSFLSNFIIFHFLHVWRVREGRRRREGTHTNVLGMCARSLVFVLDTDALEEWSDKSNANVVKRD